jgi:hypothetical protein
MITIFQGRKLSLDGGEQAIYAEVAVALRDQIQHFRAGGSWSPFAVFIKIALHADRYGWAFPTKAEIRRKTGVASKDTLSRAIRHLQTMRLEGHRVLEVWRERRADGRFGRTLYRIFPDAWDDGLAHIPQSFSADGLSRLSHDADPRPSPDGPDPVSPRPEEPDPDVPVPKDLDYKESQVSKEHQDTRSGGAWPGDCPVLQRSGDEPRIRGQPPAGSFAPCALAAFIATHSPYRFKPGEQHERLLHPVRAVGGQEHPAPNDLYGDEVRGEAFQAWVLAKITWAGGRGDPRKPLRSLVSAIRNYGHPQFGWFVFWDHWVRQGGGGDGRGDAAGHPGGTEAPGRGPPEQESGMRQRHRAQVARFLARTGTTLG